MGSKRVSLLHNGMFASAVVIMNRFLDHCIVCRRNSCMGCLALAPIPRVMLAQLISSIVNQAQQSAIKVVQAWQVRALASPFNFCGRPGHTYAFHMACMMAASKRFSMPGFF